VCDGLIQFSLPNQRNRKVVARPGLLRRLPNTVTLQHDFTRHTWFLSLVQVHNKIPAAHTIAAATHLMRICRIVPFLRKKPVGKAGHN
jgi:hypothetical protein